jgi:hypothetical protein
MAGVFGDLLITLKRMRIVNSVPGCLDSGVLDLIDSLFATQGVAVVNFYFGWITVIDNHSVLVIIAHGEEFSPQMTHP